MEGAQEETMVGVEIHNESSLGGQEGAERSSSSEVLAQSGNNVQVPEEKNDSTPLTFQHPSKTKCGTNDVLTSPKSQSLTVSMGDESDDASSRRLTTTGKDAQQQQNRMSEQRVVSFRRTASKSLDGNTLSNRQIIKKEKLIGGKYTKREMIFVTTVGVLLSFNSGYVNGSCLSGLLSPSGVKQSVAAFTGSYTNSALGLADGQFASFGRQVGMILSFILGACISGYMTPNATPYRLEPTYGPTFMIGGVFLTISSILAVFDQTDYLFYFAAAASGIQNGISSIYSANLIRSTHLTGTSTDIGIFLGQLLHGNKQNSWKLLVLIALASSFWLGSLISFYATTFFTHFSLLFNAGLFMMIGVALVFFIVVELEVSFEAAVMGTWMWGKIVNELSKCDVFQKQSYADFFDGLEGTQDDGELDKQELLDALIKAGVRVSKHQVDVLLRAADKDGNGKIDKEEWLKITSNSERLHNSSHH